MRNIETCPHCAAGDTPFRMKRNTVHHFPSTGRLIICVDAELKPRS